MLDLRTIAATVVLILSTLACSRWEDRGAAVEPSVGSTNEIRATEYRRQDYLRARTAAQAWLDALDLDPVELSRRGIKGKKKLAEILDCYVTLLKHLKNSTERRALRQRLEVLAQHVARPEYHDMQEVSDREFTENSMSYLRVAWLLENVGLSTERYRTEILKIQPRLDAHLPGRGPWQQAMFLDYYNRFGLTKPVGLSRAPLGAGLIARRHPHSQYTVSEVYDLTHEVFVAFEYGNQRTQTTFSRDDLNYVRAILPILVARFTAAKDPDLVGELTSCLTYFGWQTMPAHRQAVNFLLDSQNTTGSWGSYEAYRSRFGKYLEYHAYLHTTMVVLQPLLETYDPIADAKP